MFPENSTNWSSCSPFCSPSFSPTCSCIDSFLELLVSPLQSHSEGPGARASLSNLGCWACGVKHLLQDCSHSPAPAGTWNLTSHVPMTFSNLHSHPASGAPMPKCALVPQVDGPPESPALHGDTGENEFDQDIMITGYDQPSKPSTKVILSEYPPLLATLPLQVARDMMCKSTVHILYPKVVLQKQSFPN